MVSFGGSCFFLRTLQRSRSVRHHGVSEKRQKSYSCFLDELKRCEQLGLLLYNFQCVLFPLLHVL